jgi:hypothetical protein
MLNALIELLKRIIHIYAVSILIGALVVWVSFGLLTWAIIRRIRELFPRGG